MIRALDRPIAAAALGLALALVVVGLHMIREGGDVSRFVRAGPPFADPAAVPAGLTVTDAGYDGMFYYRLALDPFTDRSTADGITLDLPAYRQQRIAYPLLAWIASFGDASKVPVALVAVNLAGLALLGEVGGILARRFGRHALWGVLFPAYPGFVMTLTRDLTEIVAAVAVLGSLLLLRQQRTVAAGISLAAGLLARETTILVAGAAGITRLLARPRRPSTWAPFALPVAVLVGTQMLLAAHWGTAASSQGASALDPPFMGLLAALWLDPQRYDSIQLATWLAVVAFVAVLIVAAWRSVGSVAVGPHERLAWILYLGLAVVLEANIWANGAVLRALTELAMLSCLFVLTAPARWRWALLGAELAAGAVVLWAGPAI